MEAPNAKEYNIPALDAKDEEEWRICHETTRFSYENVRQLENVMRSVEVDFIYRNNKPDLRAYITDMVCGPHCDQFMVD